MNFRRHLKHGICLLALFLIILVAVACRPSLRSSSTGMITATSALPTPSLTPGDRSTAQLAAGYLSAVASSDQAALRNLIGTDAWCSTPDTAGMINKHVKEYASAQLRNVKIEELDINGWVAYPPGAEAAHISFEYRMTSSEGWAPASMVVVTVLSPNTNIRFICNVTD